MNNDIRGWTASDVITTPAIISMTGGEELGRFLSKATRLRQQWVGKESGDSSNRAEPNIVGCTREGHDGTGDDSL